MTRIEIRIKGSGVVVGTLKLSDADIFKRADRTKYIILGNVAHDVYFDGAFFYIYR